jgi:SRSO17 transposase
MTHREMRKLDRELSEYLETMVEGLGRSERRQALEWYLTGLLLDGERKSVEPMAARLVEDEGEVEAMRQRLQRVLKWSSQASRLSMRSIMLTWMNASDEDSLRS